MGLSTCRRRGPTAAHGTTGRVWARGLYPVAYAITGAKIVTAPGKVLDPGTIVVRRGVIEAVGLTKDVTVPYDAETIDGKGTGGLSGLHRPLFDGRPAGWSRSVGNRQGPARLTWPRRRLIFDSSGQPQGFDPRVRGCGGTRDSDTLAEPQTTCSASPTSCRHPCGAIATGQSACELERASLGVRPS